MACQRMGGNFCVATCARAAGKSQARRRIEGGARPDTGLKAQALLVPGNIASYKRHRCQRNASPTRLCLAPRLPEPCGAYLTLQRLRIAVDHQNALRTRRIELRHIDLNRPQRIMRERQLGHAARPYPPFEALTSQNTRNQVYFGFVKRRVNFLPCFIS